MAGRRGRLFVIVGERPVMEAMLVRRLGPNEWSWESLFETVIPPLVNAAQPDKLFSERPVAVAPSPIRKRAHENSPQAAARRHPCSPVTGQGMDLMEAYQKGCAVIRWCARRKRINSRSRRESRWRAARAAQLTGRARNHGRRRPTATPRRFSATHPRSVSSTPATSPRSTGR